MTKLWEHIMILFVGLKAVKLESDSLHYIGCFDILEPNIFLEVEYIHRLKISQCTTICSNRNYLAITGFKCHCLLRIPEVSGQLICDFRCYDDANLRCGGDRTYSVYKIIGRTTTTTTVATTSTTPQIETTTVATPSTTPGIETTPQIETTINTIRGLDQHTTVLIVSVIVICVLLIVLSMNIYIICRYSRNSHRQSQKIQSVASNDDAPDEKVNTKYVRDERKPKHDACKMKNQRKFQTTAVEKEVNDYEPLNDHSHVYSHLHRSLDMKNEIATLVEVHTDANSQSLENKGQGDDEIRLITSTLVPDKANKDFKKTSRSKSNYESISEDAEIDNIQKGHVYIDISGTVPKSIYHKMDRQSCLQSGSMDSNSKPQCLTFPMTPKQSDSKEEFTTVPNVNSLYEQIRSNDDDDDDDDDGDAIDKDQEYVDMDAAGPEYPSPGSIRKKHQQIGSFYTNKHQGTKEPK